jgi:ABC-type transporter Mla MlaB component
MHDDTLALPQELTVYTIAEQRAIWRRWLADAEAELSDRPADAAFVVDASAVAEIDAAGVQLLLSLACSLAARHRALTLAAPSRALSVACAGLGVGTRLLGAEAPESRE